MKTRLDDMEARLVVGIGFPREDIEALILIARTAEKYPGDAPAMREALAPLLNVVPRYDALVERDKKC